MLTNCSCVWANRQTPRLGGMLKGSSSFAAVAPSFTTDIQVFCSHRQSEFRKPSSTFFSIENVGLSGATKDHLSDCWKEAKLRSRGVRQRAIVLSTSQEIHGQTIESEGDGFGRVSSVDVQDTGYNSRRICAQVVIRVPLEVVWDILTDYENLADFVPGLAVNEVLERKAHGARLLQIAEQNLALGVKYRAKAVVEVEEYEVEVSEHFVKRDLKFKMVDGDFQVFSGVWHMKQVTGKTSLSNFTMGDDTAKTSLAYVLDVKPKLWLPAGLVERRLCQEITKNLDSIRDRAMGICAPPQ